MWHDRSHVSPRFLWGESADVTEATMDNLPPSSEHLPVPETGPPTSPGPPGPPGQFAHGHAVPAQRGIPLELPPLEGKIEEAPVESDE